MEKEKQEIVFNMIKDEINNISLDFVYHVNLYNHKLVSYDSLDNCYELSLSNYYDIEKYIDYSHLFSFIDSSCYLKLIIILDESKEKIKNLMSEV